MVELDETQAKTMEDWIAFFLIILFSPFIFLGSICCTACIMFIAGWDKADEFFGKVKGL